MRYMWEFDLKTILFVCVWGGGTDVPRFGRQFPLSLRALGAQSRVVRFVWQALFPTP